MKRVLLTTACHMTLFFSACGFSVDDIFNKEENHQFMIKIDGAEIFSGKAKEINPRNNNVGIEDDAKVYLLEDLGCIVTSSGKVFKEFFSMTVKCLPPHQYHEKKGYIGSIILPLKLETINGELICGQYADEVLYFIEPTFTIQ